MFNNVLISSGPTLEPIDPVRFLSNRSSGKSGYHLATEARQRGIANVTFVTGPSAYIPTDVRLIRIETAQELREAMLARCADAEVIVMAAAVCDYRSVRYYPEKLKKDNERITLEFIKNPDILQELGLRKRPGQVLVGYAAETDNIFENATRKLKTKNLDLLILNEISDANPAFGSEENQVFFVTAGGIKKLDRMSKSRLAAFIWDEIAQLAGRK